MDLAAAKKDLRERQAKVVSEVNQITADIQKLTQKRQQLLIEAERLNGENAMLQRLSKNGKGSGRKPKK